MVEKILIAGAANMIVGYDDIGFIGNSASKIMAFGGLFCAIAVIAKIAFIG